MKKKVVLVSIRDQMYEAIKESILTNTYAPGEELQIHKLAENFGVSTTPVRETLIKLESVGLVTLIPNKGAKVTGIKEEDVRNTWEMRRLLEPYAARITATMPLDSELNDLDNKIHKVLQKPYDFSAYRNSDIGLHELLYIYLPNMLLKETLKRVHQMSMRMRYFAEDDSLIQKEVILEVTKEHLLILEALNERNAEKAADAVLFHLINGEKRILQAIKTRTES